MTAPELLLTPEIRQGGWRGAVGVGEAAVAGADDRGDAGVRGRGLLHLSPAASPLLLPRLLPPPSC